MNDPNNIRKAEQDNKFLDKRNRDKVRKEAIDQDSDDEEEEEEKSKD